MFVHVTFRAPAHLVTPHRLSLAWAILRLRHPLLASQIHMTPGSYDDARFVYSPPSTPQQAVLQAQDTFDVLTDGSVDDLVDDYLNGPRFLSTDRLSYIHLAARVDDTSLVREYNLLMYIAHVVCDGYSAHGICNSLFVLLGSSHARGLSVNNNEELASLLQYEWQKRWSSAQTDVDVIPRCAEQRIPSASNKFLEVASKLEFAARQSRFIGGHAFPKVPSDTHRSVIMNASFDATKTAAILAKCRSERVTVSNALFVICNFAWISTMRALGLTDNSETLPMMMYTALSLRPFCAPRPPQESFLFLAISYLNVILPSFMPSTISEAETFWHRARLIRRQCAKYIQSTLLPLRVQHMSKERGIRAKTFAKEDDNILQQSSTSTSSRVISRPPQHVSSSAKPALAVPQKPPSVALIGLSQLNNLDDVYIAADYPDFDLSYVGGHTRKQPGGMLLFTQTFRGKLWLIFGWDASAYQQGVVEAFWERVCSGVEEFMSDGAMQKVECKL